MAYKPRSRREPYRKGRKPSGASTKHRTFEPNNEQLVRMIAAHGASDDEIEEMFGLEEGTIAAWKERHPRFAKALAEGRSKPDADVLFALHRNACGYEYEEEQAVGGRVPCVLKVKKHARGSFEAQRYWLSQRKRDDWRPVTRSELSGPNGGPVGVKQESRSELIDAILSMVHPKPDPDSPKPKQDKRR